MEGIAVADSACLLWPVTEGRDRPAYVRRITAAAVAKVVAVLLALAVLGVLVLGVFRLVGEAHKQNCIAEAQARFPAVGLTAKSPFSGPQAGGPSRVANTKARDAALDRCKATAL